MVVSNPVRCQFQRFCFMGNKVVIMRHLLHFTHVTRDDKINDKKEISENLHDEKYYFEILFFYALAANRDRIEPEHFDVPQWSTTFHLT